MGWCANFEFRVTNCQYAGEVRKVHAARMRELLDGGDICLVGPLGYATTGEVFNCSSEDVATACAIQLKVCLQLILSPVYLPLCHTDSVHTRPAHSAHARCPRCSLPGASSSTPSRETPPSVATRYNECPAFWTTQAQKLIFLYEGDEVMTDSPPATELAAVSGSEPQPDMSVVSSLSEQLAQRCIDAMEDHEIHLAAASTQQAAVDSLPAADPPHLQEEAGSQLADTRPADGLESPAVKAQGTHASAYWYARAQSLSSPVSFPRFACVRFCALAAWPCVVACVFVP